MKYKDLKDLSTTFKIENNVAGILTLNLKRDESKKYSFNQSICLEGQHNSWKCDSFYKKVDQILHGH